MNAFRFRPRSIRRALPLLAALALAALAAPAHSLALAPYGAGFGVVPGSYKADAFKADGTPERQAGAHPDRALSTFELKDMPDPGLEFLYPTFSQPDGDLHEVKSDLPRGFVGELAGVPTCTPPQLRASGIGQLGGCPIASQVGVINLILQNSYQRGTNFPRPVYNMTPPKGAAAELSFAPGGRPIDISISLNPYDYSVHADVRDINQFAPVLYQSLVLWGAPWAASNDDQRCVVTAEESAQPGNPIGVPGVIDESRSCAAGMPVVKPFITLPTQCGVDGVTALRVDSWQHPGVFDEPPAQPAPAAQLSGCNQLDFSPEIEARPSTNHADSPSGLDVKLRIPQNEDPNGDATAQLREAVVKLPAGVTVNPASANGLEACTPAQIGLTTPVGQAAAHFTGEEPHCPEPSSLGSVEIDSPAVSHTLPGTIYLASQGQNPFGSLLALYLTVDDPISGVVVKLPGKVVADPQTGQLTASFEENPQLPFSELRASFFGGARAALRTPATCGSFTTETSMTPWSAPEGAVVHPSDSFAIERGAGEAGCASGEGQLPSKPAFSAGTIDPSAGAYSPFVMKVAREDGSQQIKGLDATLPKGLLAKLAGVAYCPDSALASAAGHSGRQEQASPSCPAASQVGSVNVGAGAGPTPVYVAGKAYLAGPYKGAPLSLAIVTPAVAGPFDLGTVVVRAALDINPETAQVHVVSDPIPTILQGIPLDVRTIAVQVDRNQFTRNPTSCDASAVDASTTTLLGQSSSLSSRFQVGDCASLGFKPKLALSLKGGTSRGDHPALKAVLTQGVADGANIARGSVSLPHSEFLENEHIKTICTRVQFAVSQCPAGAVYGSARAFTPLLDQPVEGPVYLRSSSNQLPDLVADLHGQVDVVLVGRIDSVHGGIRTSFESVPDAPVSKFVLEMQGGKKGLLVNSRNLCRSAQLATAEFDGQNGKTADQKPALANSCKKKKKGKGKKGKGKPHSPKHSH